MLKKNIKNGYKVEYEEIKKKNTFFSEYIPQIKLYKNGTMVLSSENKEKEEFFNYLSFLVPEDIFHIIKEIYNNWGSTEEEIALRDIYED